MQRYTILLAEDDADDREIFEEILHDKETVQRLKTVENGLEVINALNDGLALSLPDLIILDHNMPKMNGKQTLEYLKSTEKFSRIPVIMYSTYNDRMLSDECTRLGALHIATKPTTYHEFKGMIEKFLTILNTPSSVEQASPGSA
jgi:CheY-like chemotaxis protein